MKKNVLKNVLKSVLPTVLSNSKTTREKGPSAIWRIIWREQGVTIQSKYSPAAGLQQAALEPQSCGLGGLGMAMGTACKCVQWRSVWWSLALTLESGLNSGCRSWATCKRGERALQRALGQKRDRRIGFLALVFWYFWANMHNGVSLLNISDTAARRAECTATRHVQEL